MLLCALSSHLLPLFICRGWPRGEGSRLDCMFSSPAQPLCLQAAGGGGGGSEADAGDVKPDLLPSLLPSSLLLLFQCHLARASETPRVIRSSARKTGNPLREKDGGREGAGKGEMETEQRKRERFPSSASKGGKFPRRGKTETKPSEAAVRRNRNR